MLELGCENATVGKNRLSSAHTTRLCIDIYTYGIHNTVIYGNINNCIVNNLTLMYANCEPIKMNFDLKDFITSCTLLYLSINWVAYVNIYII